MNLRAYFEAIQKIEAEIVAAEVAVLSCETADGGREGVRSTVPRKLAAKLIVDGKVILAPEKKPGRADESAHEHPGTDTRRE